MDQKLLPYAASIASAAIEPAADTIGRRRWALYIVVLGVVLSLAWIAFIGYGITLLITLPF
jgi:hypothetical protein